VSSSTAATRWSLAPTVLALAFGIAYLILEPRPGDLAAHVFRAELFGREGFTIWNGQWYGGHHTPAYSVLSPPLAWLIGPRLLLVVATVASAALFEVIMRERFGAAAARWGTLWFGLGSATLLATSRMPFAVGVAFGLAAVLALQRGRPRLSCGFAVLSTLGSPVAGLFLAMGGAAYAVGHRGEQATRRRRAGLALAGAALIPPVCLSLAFPEGGYAPFPFTAYVTIPIFCVACLLLLPRQERTLRVGAALYAVGSTLAYFMETPMGGNAARLGALFGGPLLACVLWEKRPRQIHIRLAPLAAAVLALFYWQWISAERDMEKAIRDPAAHAGYFEPLQKFLATLPDETRIEIPFTTSHWEGTEVAPTMALARGWLRQLDTGLNPVFYKGPLNRLTYASWLSENAVRYVALPDAKPDKSTYVERALIEQGLPYLRQRWKSKHWRVYEVLLPAPFVVPQGDANIRLARLGSDELTLRVRRPGQAVVRVRWTPYWYAHGGCVERDGAWTRVTAPRRGYLRLSTRFSPLRVVSRGRRCGSSGPAPATSLTRRA
jgi:hypothetical protein